MTKEEEILVKFCHNCYSNLNELSEYVESKRQSRKDYLEIRRNTDDKSLMLKWIYLKNYLFYRAHWLNILDK